MNLRFSTILAAALMLGSSQTWAADMAVATKAAPLSQPYSWNGFYLGAHAGYGFNTSNQDAIVTAANVVTLADSLATSPQGFLGGLHAGWGMTLGILYWGIETDIDIAALNATSLGGSLVPITATTKQKWFGDTGLRLGLIPFGHLMLYATGGFAYGDGTTDFTLATINPSASQTKTGWMFGGGVEVLLSDNWRLATEYKRIDLGKMTLTETMGTATLAVGQKFQVDTFRVKLSKGFYQ